MACIVVLPLKVLSTLPSSLVATESHNFSEMSAATFLAVKKQAGKLEFVHLASSRQLYSLTVK